MARLDRLPAELILLIADSLCSQKDINALVQTNQTLYHLLHGFLCKYNVQHYQGKALLWAAENGHTCLVRDLLNAGANIAAFEGIPRGNPLWLAFDHGHLATVKILLSETRPNRSCTRKQLRSTLQWAISIHDQKIVELLLQYKVPLDPIEDSRRIGREDARNLSALGYSVSFRFPAIIPLLIEQGAQPGSYEDPGPVESAICTDQPEVAELLLKHGVPLTSDAGLCHVMKHNNKELFQLLVKYGMQMDYWGHIPLFWAIIDGSSPEMVGLLIDHGANPHLSGQLVIGLWREVYDLSPIGFAVYFGHLDIVKLLLEKGVQPLLSDLHMAEKKEDVEALAILSELSYEGIKEKEDVEIYTTSRAQDEAARNPEFRILFTMRPLYDPDTE
ncbi:hypothetical protein ARAM_003638 [Aspergillus rambellii]|uniref:Uncharacterized protein n=1 Tax=Aspergillus rambellii TaxID=308745 RepID=A0A0F8VMF7_9EURO|nr:hypothetical protein ARAM_003638 [Aspergillus rambellii]